MNLDHLSYSQWRAWASCPAAAWAQYVGGLYRPGTTEAMSLGALTESAMTATGEPADIIASLEPDHREFLVTKKGEPTTAAVRAVEWGRATAKLPYVRAAMDGATLQASLDCVLGGVVWRCRLDIWDSKSGLVWDIKTTADPLAEEWVPRLGCRGNFIAARGYGYQLALYQHAVEQETGEKPDVGILAIGKHKTRDGEAIPDVWFFAWQDIAQLDGYREALAASCQHPWTCELGATVRPIPELYAMTDGADLPRCESCDWCIASRTEPIRAYSDPERRRQ